MRLLLGVTGGIAAYKAAALASLAVRRGHEVRVIMTEAATRFVGPLTFEGLTGAPPLIGRDHLAPGRGMAHIDWGRWAEAACVAPLTANTMAKLALGLADDALTTTLLALPREVPLVIAPAMNTRMWEHPATRGHAEALAARGAVIVEPADRRLACGEVGVGAMAEPDVVLGACERAAAERSGA